MSSTKELFPFFFVLLVGLFFAAGACGDNSTASQAPHQVQGDQNRPSLSTLVQRFDPKRGHWTDVTIAELEPKASTSTMMTRFINSAHGRTLRFFPLAG